MKKFIHFLSHPAWSGISGFFTILGVLTALRLSTVVVAWLTGMLNRIQDLWIWLLEPLTAPRYVLVIGTIVLIAFVVAEILPFLSSGTRLLRSKRKNESIVTKPIFQSVSLPAGLGNAY